MAAADRRAGGLQCTIGAKVRRLRKAKRISQEELAHICGYHRTYVGMVERRERNISIATLAALAGALSVQAHELLLEP